MRIHPFWGVCNHYGIRAEDRGKEEAVKPLLMDTGRGTAGAGVGQAAVAFRSVRLNALTHLGDRLIRLFPSERP